MIFDVHFRYDTETQRYVPGLDGIVDANVFVTDLRDVSDAAPFWHVHSTHEQSCMATGDVPAELSEQLSEIGELMLDDIAADTDPDPSDTVIHSVQP